MSTIELELADQSIYGADILSAHERGERIRERIIAEVSSIERGTVIVEGPPLYVWPHEDYPVQDPSHAAFRGGWEYLDSLAADLPGGNYQHWILVDDFNNRPPEATIENSAENQALSLIGSSAPRIQTTTAHWESDFARENGQNGCSNLDAGFQRKKLQAAFDRESTATPLFVVVHPVEFAHQQRQMLMHLLGELKQGQFAQMPKVARRRLIEDVYRHIWIDQDGEVVSCTQPQWNGNGFSFLPIDV